MKRGIKVLVAKIGLDAHDRGVLVLMKELRDAGMEVVWAGKYLTPEQVITPAIQENVEIICVSTLAGGYMPLIAKLTDLLRENGLGSVPLLVGGIINPTDIPTLHQMGVRKVFRPNVPVAEVLTYMHEAVAVAID